MLGSYNFKQLIDTPKRVTQNSSTMIDIICSTKSETIIEHGCVHTSLSDHYLVYGIRRIPQSKTNSTKLIKFRPNKQLDNDDFLKGEIHSKIESILKERVYFPLQNSEQIMKIR